MTLPYNYFAIRRSVRGFTLVEALVALVVLAVGMLGISSLYITTLRASSSAISRMNAINLAGDVADRIRANRSGSNAYAVGPAANNNCNGGAIGAVTCTPAQLAADDLFWWQQQLAATWPGGAGTGTVVYTPGNPPTYQITVTWTEPGQDPLTPLSYVLTMQNSELL
jgi:type IV pilus assembly protein PilV